MGSARPAWKGRGLWRQLQFFQATLTLGDRHRETNKKSTKKKKMQNYVFFSKMQKSDGISLQKNSSDVPELFKFRRLHYTDRTKRANVFHHLAQLCHQKGRPWFLALAFGEPWDQVTFLKVLSGASGPGPLLGLRKHLLDLSSFRHGEQGTPPISKEFKVSA